MKRISVRAVIDNDGKYLLTRLVIANRFWCLPGGGVDDGENLLSALTRELVEELGVIPKIGNLLFVHQLTSDLGQVESTSFFFHIKNPKDYLNIDISKTSHGQKEIIEFGFKDAATIHLLPSFLKTELYELREKNYSLSTRIKTTKFEDKN